MTLVDLLRAVIKRAEGLDEQERHRLVEAVVDLYVQQVFGTEG